MTRRLALFVFAAALAGCSRDISVPKTAAVRGTVLYKGRAAPGVRVTFHPRFDMGSVKFTPSATTDKDGRFTLSTGAVGDGAPPGEYAVTFALPRVESDRKSSGIELEVDAWKGKYDDPAASRWQVRVQGGDNELEPFRLE